MPCALVVRAFAGLALMIATLLMGAPARAQQSPAPTIIIVDSTQVLRASKAAKDIQGQIDKQMAAYSKQVSQQENELQRMRDELERQRTVLAPEVFNNRMREYQQRFETLDRSVQGKRKALQQSYNEAMSKVENTALQIIADLAKERKANLVLTKAAVIFEADGFDVTGEVIKRLDAKLPSVAVNLPKDAAGAGSAKGSPPSKKK